MTDHPDVIQVDEVAAELLDEARGLPARRTARTLFTGQAQRATLIALAEGAELSEHTSNPGATLQVISGRVRLHTRDREWVLDRGQLAAIPTQRQGLTALADAVVLLTTAQR
jgi:quercetin dioxygenase-like cupin family protein